MPIQLGGFNKREKTIFNFRKVTFVQGLKVSGLYIFGQPTVIQIDKIWTFTSRYKCSHFLIVLIVWEIDLLHRNIGMLLLKFLNERVDQLHLSREFILPIFNRNLWVTILSCLLRSFICCISFIRGTGLTITAANYNSRQNKKNGEP
ncbi:hypothetical protein D3C71_1186630 [compost metagenome]